MSDKKIKVCVIGAGAAGLCAARHLAANSQEFEFTVFEKSSDIGGTWIYTDNVGVDDNGLPIHSSMYKNLRTNLPKEIMSFPDFPEMKGERKSCVTHETVLNYLKDYTKNFNLILFIEFNTLVESVRPVSPNEQCSSKKWHVKLKNVKNSETKEETFDAIIVCNGHYFEPYIPSIIGLDNFSGQIIHSHNYRIPEAFFGKNVLVLGASSSGIDIAFELSDKASQVFLSHDNERLSTGRNSLGIIEVQGIEKYENNAFIMKDGEKLENIDVFVFCTGYHFAYPFLDESCGISVDENYISPLYKHMINIKHPSMCLIGIPSLVVPFPLFDVQVRYFLSLLKGTTQLPSSIEMLNDAKLKVSKKRHAHKIGSTQWAYNEELARVGQFEALPAYYKLGYEAWSLLKKPNLRDYKKFNLIIEADALSVRIVK